MAAFKILFILFLSYYTKVFLLGTQQIQLKQTNKHGFFYCLQKYVGLFQSIAEVCYLPIK